MQVTTHQAGLNSPVARLALAQRIALAALAIFLSAWWLLTPLQNHGLWAALYVLYAARAATLACFFPRLARSVPA